MICRQVAQAQRAVDDGITVMDGPSNAARTWLEPLSSPRSVDGAGEFCIRRRGLDRARPLLKSLMAPGSSLRSVGDGGCGSDHGTPLTIPSEDRHPEPPERSSG